MMRPVVCFWLFVLVFLITGCSQKEQLYQGMYNGFRSTDQQMQTQDPSYTPLQAREQNQASYQQYKKEREQILDPDAATTVPPDTK